MKHTGLKMVGKV